jgi:methylenetetrahydrofolate dehydrogenase (NADP+)/methenyltetrahydrofolate cyclohydrolase
MAILLTGREVSVALNQQSKLRSQKLCSMGIQPSLAVIRCGENHDALSYEKSLGSKADECGIKIIKYILPENVKKQELLGLIQAVNADQSIHGCLIFRPLPGGLMELQDEICATLSPEKDVDCCTAASSAGVYLGNNYGFPPCTAEACIHILRHYNIPLAGKHVVVIGRSLVVGRPVSMLLLRENATVTVCHSHTVNMPELCRQADIIISAAGHPGLLTADYVRPGQVVLDVSVSWAANMPNKNGGLGRLVGDAVFDDIEPIVSAISPVPGGVGTVTSSVLISHVISAAERSLQHEQ